MSENAVKVRCMNCLVLNRLPAGKLRENPRCGSCKNVLTVPNQPAYARKDSFDRDVSYWPETLLVMFTSVSAVYCRIAEPLVNDLAAKHAGRLKVLKVDADEDAYFTQRYKVTQTPTFLVFKAGEFVIRLDGPLKEKAELVQWIENLINYTSY